MKRAFIKIVRTESKEKEFEYQLIIEQSFDDGRYHNTEDGEEVPQKTALDISQIRKLFFSISGKLLRLEERDSPVLVLKTVSTQKKEKNKEKNDLESILWYAFGLFEEDEESDDSDEEKEAGELEEQVKSDYSSSISLLEYIIRLVSLQEDDQKSILDINDERLSIYLNDESPRAATVSPKDIEAVTTKIGKISLD